MTAEQAYAIERLARETNSGDADLLRLARECAQDGDLVCLGELHRIDADNVIDTLISYARQQVTARWSRDSRN